MDDAGLEEGVGRYEERVGRSLGGGGRYEERVGLSLGWGGEGRHVMAERHL